MASKKEGFYTFTRSYFGVKVYLCRKIVRIMDQEAKIRELERRLDRQDRHQVIILLLILMLVITILLKVQ